MTPASTHNALPRPLTLSVVGMGPFGRRVASFLSSARNGSLITEFADVESAFISDCHAVIIALWRYYSSLCDRADELSYAHATPWIPVIMEHPVVHIGPLVIPPVGPCFRCYRRRRAQHDAQPQATAMLAAAYAKDPELGPAGYLPHHARVAATVAARMGDTARLADTGQPGLHGNVVTFGLVSNAIRIDPVVACHDCRRCGIFTGPVSDLRKVLMQLPVSDSH
jgi:bacteriocin biosynthesis cyclodehydratase domain-containing protein